MHQFSIISGGQTGADRAALDIALEVKIPCGGWCPAGRKAEDGIIHKKYPLLELDRGDYDDRTRKNVEESDGTVIFYESKLQGGSLLTRDWCRQVGKPILLLELEQTDITRSAGYIMEFCQNQQIHKLNIAGPRKSESEHIYQFVYLVLREFFLSFPR